MENARRRVKLSPRSDLAALLGNVVASRVQVVPMTIDERIKAVNEAFCATLDVLDSRIQQACDDGNDSKIDRLTRKRKRMKEMLQAACVVKKSERAARINDYYMLGV